MKYSKTPMFKLIRFEAKLCFGNCPLLMCAEIVASIIHGCSDVLITIVMQMFFDQAASAIGYSESYNKVLVYAVICGCVVIANQIINGGENYLWQLVYDKIYGYSYYNLFDKSLDTDAEEYEKAKFLDLLKKAYNGAENYIQPLFTVIALSTYYLAYFLGIGWYMFTKQPILCLAIVFVFIPSLIGQIIKVRLYAKLVDESISAERRFEYYEQCMVGREYFKESRTLKAIPFLKKKYINELDILSEKRWRTNKKATFIIAIVKTITLVGYLGIVLLLVYELVNRRISVGTFSALFISIGTLFEMMEEVMGTIGDCTENIGSMFNYLKFVDFVEEKLRRQKKERSCSHNKGIQLNDVSYKYADSEDYSLKNVNITIHPNETIAIVGENGSGKTTLAKVIAGLLDATEGCVKYGDVDIATCKKKDIYSRISVVSQWFQRYKMTLRQNVSISRNELSEGDDTAIINELNKVGIDIHNNPKFSDGLDTVLSVEFGGIDLSGGQWQRIAIARGLYRENDIFILDEPTAAIDPIEETRLFELFASQLKHNTAIIVTHRLGCVKLADRIIVVDNGKIIEEGSHDKLMSEKGKYYNMYNAQSKWYVW